MKNSIIVGFTSTSQSKAIYKCIENGYFDCKLWISNKSTHEHAIKVHDLFSSDFLAKDSYEFVPEYETIFNKYFHVFVHSVSREKSDYTYFEFVNLFNLQFYYFYNLIKKNNISLLIATNFMHEADYLLYPIAKEIFNLEIIIFNQTPFTNKFWYVNSLEDYGTFDEMKSLENNTESSEKVISNLEIDVFYMKMTLSKRIKKNCLFNFLFKDLEKIFSKKRNLTFMQQFNKYIKCKTYQKNLDKHSVSEVNLDEKFVYCPLHLQPELTTSILGEKYSDQLLMIEKISKLIPDDWKIYVKENPYQTHFQRDKLFFDRLMNDKKVVMIKDINSAVLIKNCQFLANISGTAGWEALQAKKAVLLFGQAWYLSMPGAFLFEDLKSFDEIANYEFKEDELENEFNSLLSYSFEGIVDNDYLAIHPNYNDDENMDHIYNAINKTLEKNKELIS